MQSWQSSCPCPCSIGYCVHDRSGCGSVMSGIVCLRKGTSLVIFQWSRECCHRIPRCGMQYQSFHAFCLSVCCLVFSCPLYRPNFLSYCSSSWTARAPSFLIPHCWFMPGVSLLICFVAAANASFNRFMYSACHPASSVPPYCCP